MNIKATINSDPSRNKVVVETEGNQKELNLPSKVNAQGIGVNGGELLFLSLATCFVNDLYREATRRKISITSIQVEVSGTFGKEGEPASKIEYQVNVLSDNPTPEIEALVKDVDQIAEIHATLRKGINVSMIARNGVD